MTSPLWEPWNRRSRPGSDESDCQIGERSNQGSHCLWHNLNYCFHRVFLLREEGGCRWVGASDFIISWAACAYKNSIFVSRSSQQTLFWSFKKMFLHLTSALAEKATLCLMKLSQKTLFTLPSTTTSLSLFLGKRASASKLSSGRHIFQN